MRYYRSQTFRRDLRSLKSKPRGSPGGVLYTIHQLRNFNYFFCFLFEFDLHSPPDQAVRGQHFRPRCDRVGYMVIPVARRLVRE